MPSRSSCSARRSPIPFRNLTGVSRRTADFDGREAVTGAPGPRRRSAWGFGQQMGGEALRIERLKVVHAFADPEEPDGQVELAAKGGHGPTAGAAVELGDHDAGRAHRRREELALLYRVLAHGAVEHEQGLVWRAGQSP